MGDSRDIGEEGVTGVDSGEEWTTVVDSGEEETIGGRNSMDTGEGDKGVDSTKLEGEKRKDKETEGVEDTLEEGEA